MGFLGYIHSSTVDSECTGISKVCQQGFCKGQSMCGDFRVKYLWLLTESWICNNYLLPALWLRDAGAAQHGSTSPGIYLDYSYKPCSPASSDLWPHGPDTSSRQRLSMGASPIHCWGCTEIIHYVMCSQWLWWAWMIPIVCLRTNVEKIGDLL